MSPLISIITYYPHRLPANVLAQLVDAVRESVHWYAPGMSDPEIVQLLTSREGAAVDVVRLDEKAIGFFASATTRVAGRKVCFHIAVSILPAGRGRHLYEQLARKALLRESCDYIVARTQNPAVYESMRKLSPVGEIYPAPGAEPDVKVHEVAQSLSSLPVESGTLIVRNAHGFARQDRSYMKSRNPETDAFFAENLGRDDGFMVVVKP